MNSRVQIRSKRKGCPSLYRMRIIGLCNLCLYYHGVLRTHRSWDSAGFYSTLLSSRHDFSVSLRSGIQRLFRRQARVDSPSCPLVVGMPSASWLLLHHLPTYRISSAISSPSASGISSPPSLILLLLFSLCFHAIVSVSFDREFARTRRLPTQFIEYAMMLFIAVTIVLSIRLVGIVH